MSETSKKAVFNLLKGKIRNQVKQKYDNKESHFKVVTPGVTAGVRGTDFVVTHDESSDLVTRVETLEGSVHLAERIGEKEIDVGRGESVTYVMDGRPRNQASDWNNLPVKGIFNPVRKLSVAEYAALARATDLDSGKRARAVVKRVETPICKSPSGKLNQCAWKCLNNPKGARTCMTDKANVVCARYRCNANGEWADETRLPASAHAECKGEADLVGDCDY
jgi:hypothetical protein